MNKEEQKYAMDRALERLLILHRKLEEASEKLDESIIKEQESYKNLREIAELLNQAIHAFGNLITIAMGWKFLGKAEGLDDIELDAEIKRDKD